MESEQSEAFVTSHILADEEDKWILIKQWFHPGSCVLGGVPY